MEEILLDLWRWIREVCWTCGNWSYVAAQVGMGKMENVEGGVSVLYCLAV
jgi:hypothetical protein